MQAGLCSNCPCVSLRKTTSRRMLPPREANPDKLTLVLEPESAACFCQNMQKKDFALYCKSKVLPSTQENYIVVDIGGGTIDIATYKIDEDNIEIVSETTGGPWGGIKVNEEFKKYLETLTEDEGFSSFVETPSQEVNICN